MHKTEERESVQNMDKRSPIMLCMRIILPIYFQANISKKNSRKMDKGL